MITGGCCHDYPNQKNIISEGISERVPTKWDIFFEMDQEKSKAKLSQSGWADGYDYVVYNHCFAHEKDAAFVKSITEVHKAGKPAIALHCAMHSYHWSIPAKEGEKKAWPEMLGASSKGHGPKAAITVNKVKKHAKHPIMKDMVCPFRQYAIRQIPHVSLGARGKPFQHLFHILSDHGVRGEYRRQVVVRSLSSVQGPHHIQMHIFNTNGLNDSWVGG